MIKQSPQQSKLEQKEIKSQDRIFLNETVLDHDLYKLEVANAVKNISFSDIPNLVNAEHVHFFHSIDSNGRKQETCTTIAGHCHQMILVSPATDKSPAIYKCGPAVVAGFKRVQGRHVRYYHSIPNDTHTHDITYLKSDKVYPRKPSADFAKVQGRLEPWDTAPAKVEGVIERS